MIGVVGQLLLKHGMSRHPGFSLQNVAAVIRDFSVVGGFGCYGVATLLYLKVLASLDLSIAYPTISLGYVLITLVSKVWFKEPVTPMRWVAVLVICLGVVLVGLG